VTSNLKMRIILVAADRWSIGVEHPAGHVVLIPIAFSSHDAAHLALVEWELEEVLHLWPI
jgi:hypothetical protein